MFRVPVYSQFLDVKEKKWRSRACGIVALKMVLDFWGIKKSADELIKLGLKKDAYIQGVGWKHKGLVLVAKKFGFKARNYDWYKDSYEVSFKKLLPKLKKYLVIASIYKNLKPGKSGHLVVLTGYENDQIFFNDPNSKTRGGIHKKVAAEKFLSGWKRRIIVIYP